MTDDERGAEGPEQAGVDRRASARADLSSDRFSSLWAAARTRLEGNGVTITAAPLVLRNLTATQHDAVTGLTGLAAPPGEAVRVRLDHLDVTLRAGAAQASLVEVLELVGGPLNDRRAERLSLQRDRDHVWAAAAGHRAIARHPALLGWLEQVRRRGLATRLAGDLAGMGPLVARALDALAELPAQPGTLLPVLADRLTGDPHALDRGRALGTLVFSALPALGPATDRPSAAIDAIGAELAGDDARPAPFDGLAAANWRRAWAEVGVRCDDLSVSVLVLALPVTPGDDLLTRTVHDHSRVGEPLRITLHQLTSGRGTSGPLESQVAGGAVVSICENPAVLAAAADVHGASSKPLVCLEGVPNSAAAALLDWLSAGGVRFRYHGDFDWPGLTIANSVHRRWSVDPWRMASADYRAATAGARKPLSGPTEVADWDPDLAPAMTEAGVAVHEEQVIQELVDDLRPTPGDRLTT